MNTQVSPSITVRRQQFDFNKTPLYYMDNNPLLSHLLTALSLTFPHGERFFVHSVRQIREQVKNPVLQRNISSFIGQEAMHSHAHEEFNAFVEQYNVPAKAIMDFEYHSIEEAKQRLTNKQQLAVTCALEHFTAIIAQYILEHPEIFDMLHPEIKPMWIWHALEETEHKAVAFDVYQDVFADDKVRKTTMRIITGTFLFRISHITLKLLLNDPIGRKQWRKNIAGLATLSKVLTDLAPAYFEYYRPDFHPNHYDTTQLTAHWAAQMANA